MRVLLLTKALGARGAGLEALIAVTAVAAYGVHAAPIGANSWLGTAFILICGQQG